MRLYEAETKRLLADHEVGNPSSVATRTIQSGGNGLNTSVAGGVLALGDLHGGAIEGVTTPVAPSS